MTMYDKSRALAYGYNDVRDEKARHTDLYDQMDIIPFDKLEDFFRKNLTETV